MAYSNNYHYRFVLIAGENATVPGSFLRGDIIEVSTFKCRTGVRAGLSIVINSTLINDNSSRLIWLVIIASGRARHGKYSEGPAESKTFDSCQMTFDT